MISETKLDNRQILIDGFNEPIRLDRNKLFIREDISIKVLCFETSPMEGFFIEINLYKKKWRLFCSYNSDSNNIKNHLSRLSMSSDAYSSQYEHFIVLGDFNVEVKNRDMEEFCKNYNLKSSSSNMLQKPKKLFVY